MNCRFRISEISRRFDPGSPIHRIGSARHQMLPRAGLLTSVLASARALRVPTKISMMAGPTTGRRTLYDDVTQTIGNVRATTATRAPGRPHAWQSRTGKCARDACPPGSAHTPLLLRQTPVVKISDKMCPPGVTMYAKCEVNNASPLLLRRRPRTPVCRGGRASHSAPGSYIHAFAHVARDRIAVFQPALLRQGQARSRDHPGAPRVTPPSTCHPPSTCRR